MAASAISSSSSSVYRVLSPNLDGQSANSTALPAVLSTPAPIRAAIAQPFASLIAEPEIRPSGRKPFAPGLVTVAGASIARVPKLLAFSSPSLLSVSPEGRVQDFAKTLGPRGGRPKFSEITTGGGRGSGGGSITGRSGV